MNETDTIPAQGTPLINQAIIDIMREVGAIGKERKNQAQGYNFRGIDDAMNALHHLFAKHGVFTTTTVLEQTREERANKSGGVLIYSILKIRFTFHALDGSSQESEMIGEGMDSGDKASNKSLSVALKYALLQMFMIPTKEFIDPENDSHEPSPRQLPPTRPLPPGSYQEVPTVERPVSGQPGVNAGQSVTTWKDRIAHIGKTTKGKRLGDIPESVLETMFDVYKEKDCKTKEDSLLKASLLLWHAEYVRKNPAIHKPALMAKLQGAGMSPELFGDAVRTAGIVDKITASDYSEQEAKFALDNWEECMKAVHAEAKG